MRKSKFLLLGSLSSLVAIPFVAAKCGGTKETKEDEKKPAEMPGEGQKDPKAPSKDKATGDKDKAEKDKADKTGNDSSTSNKDPKAPEEVEPNSNSNNASSNSYYNELDDRPVNYVDATGFDIGRRFQRDFNELTKQDKQDILTDVDELIKEIEEKINKKFNPYTLINTKLKSLLSEQAIKLKSKIKQNKTFDDADKSFNELFDFVEKYVK
ncbi:Variable surface lipoprotein K' (VpmaK') [Mycoplasmopsis agalactiae 14628]|uniref:Variable surface lipoprotein K' (VpmaK') n=1 Tax=Mycoplasmopsis agalactiae 14628 TaxID=1110504 RepID=I5D626_MYCAA|nr:variable surface lipoprotein [Mycoplasmopsis agalactiae]EIN15135.1 Variable surface lipoprotein K' (VpmaK') [Mycoplasmopsis agalactiae 14628]